MSKYQKKTIMEVMSYTEAQAEALLEVMNKNNDHPDWSEYDELDFYLFFKMIADEA